MQRTDQILNKINRSGIGLELGPLSSPIVDKTQGNIFYVDHMSTADLRKKYADEPVDLEKIVDVDYVLDSSLSKTFDDRKFDYVIASHVIEHIPDMVRWLDDITSILKPGGVLSLVIPDKRYTFDITRQVSRPADVIGAYVDRLLTTNSATMYDFASEYRNEVYAGEIIANPNEDPSFKERRYSEKEAYEMTKLNASGREYVDSHCLVFTPYSFFEILKKLVSHDLLKLEVVSFHDTKPGEIEFFVSLRKPTKKISANGILDTIPSLGSPKSQAELQKNIDQLEARIHNILTSSSWRMTKPFRRIVALLSK